jgi:hypothetical protein
MHYVSYEDQELLISNQHHAATDSLWIDTEYWLHEKSNFHISSTRLDVVCFDFFNFVCRIRYFWQITIMFVESIIHFFMNMLFVSFSIIHHALWSIPSFYSLLLCRMFFIIAFSIFFCNDVFSSIYKYIHISHCTNTNYTHIPSHAFNQPYDFM